MIEVTPELLSLAVTLGAVGAAAGFAAGLFGIGGGAVMVPALFFVFTRLGVPPDITMHTAVATSAAVIVVNSIRSVSSHHAHGAVDWDLLWPKRPWQSYALWIGVGAFFAALWIAPRMSGHALIILFAVISSVIALQFIFGRPDWTILQSVPGGAARPVIGGSVGILSALMGIGGGSITVPLMSMCNVPIHRAIATASGFGIAIAAPATIGFMFAGASAENTAYFSIGYVNILGFVCIAVIAFFTVPIGAKLAHRLSQRRLKLVFGICLLFVALHMMRKALGA